MAGTLTRKPPIAGMRVAARVVPEDQMFVTAAEPNLPRREVPRVSAGLVRANVVDWDRPACDIRESAGHAPEARVELRSFVRSAPVIGSAMKVSGLLSLQRANEAVEMPVASSIAPGVAAPWQAPACDFTGVGSNLGAALHQLGLSDEAAELYEKLLPASPDSVDLLSHLISLSMVRKDHVRARELAERLLEIQPEARPALEGLAGAAFSRGDYATAVQYCSRLVKIAGNSYEGWFNLGVACQKLGRLEQAAQAYRKAARLQPDSAKANVNLGATLQKCGDLDGARVAFQRARDASPELPGALWNLAIAAEVQRDVQEAEKLFEQLVAIEPDWEDAAFRLGYLQFERAEYAAAAGSFELCLKKRQDWIDALLNLGLASRKGEDLETAERTFRRVLSLDLANSAAMSLLATVLVEQKKAGEALDWHRKLRALDQPVPELSYNLGLLLQFNGDHEAAAECYQAAVDGKPEFSQAHLNLGHALRAAGKENEAQQAWSKAVVSDPQLAGQYFQ